MLRIVIEEDGEWGPKPDHWDRQAYSRGKDWPPFTRRPYKIEKVEFKWRIAGDIDSSMLRVMQAIDEAMARPSVRKLQEEERDRAQLGREE